MPGKPWRNDEAPKPGITAKTSLVKLRPNNGTDTTNASTSLRDNKSLRTALENLMKVHEIMLQAPFIQQLDQIILAGQSGKELLLDMITTASTGEDPASEGDFDHPPTQGEIIELAKRLSEAKAANNNAESIRQETERKEAAAQKAADDLAINNDEIEEIIADGENALQKAKKTPAANQPLPPMVPNILPTAAIQGPNLVPVRKASLPNIVQGAGAGGNGAPAVDQRRSSESG